MVLKGVAIVYGMSFAAGLVFAFNGMTPESHPTMYPLLALITEAVGVALAIRVAHNTRFSYLCTVGIGLWLISGTSVILGAQTVLAWLNSSAFVVLAFLLGRLLLGTVRVTPTLDLSLKGIVYDRNSGLLGHRAGRSIF
jgi:hypothetical protein